MRNKVTYEWVCEILAERPSADNDFDPDIVDGQFGDSYEQVRWYASYAIANSNSFRIAVVRNEGNEIDGLTWRGYAYVDYGFENRLQERFETATDLQDGPKVPKRFQDEINRYHR